MLTRKVIRRILAELTDACRKAPPSTVKVILFGSVARNDFDVDSDIDIMVVSTDIKEAKSFFGEIADELFLKYFVPISIVYVKPERLKFGDWFIQNVLREGKILWECGRMK